MSAPADPQSVTRTITLDEANAAVASFRQNPTQQTLASLQDLRRALVFGAMQYQGDLGAAWQQGLRPIYLALKGSGVRDMGRGPLEEQALQAARATLAEGWGNGASAGAAVAVMLLAYAHEVPSPRSLLAAPDWLRADLASWLLEMPPMFTREGEAELYTSRLEQTVALIHREVGTATGKPQRELLDCFVRDANLIQAYFSERNLKELYRMRGDLIAHALAESALYAVPPARVPRDRLRLGVYVQQLLAHTEAYYTMAALDCLDRSRFEVILYAARRTGHRLESLAASRCDRFSVLQGATPAAQANAIRADDLDILLIFTNMTAVTNGAALLGAQRLARIQVASESSPVTTGLHQIDALLTGEWNAPWKDAPEHYTEFLYRMPGSNNVYAYQYDEDKASIQPSRQAMGIGEHQLVFFSGANFFKILPELSAAWARILSQVPDSVLVLMPFNPNWSNQYLSQPFQARLAKQLAQLGVDATRLRIVMPVPGRADLHRIISLADVYLDSYPFSGACSLLDTLEAGVPPVARQGRTGRSGHAASMLRQIGMTDLVTDSCETYISLAVRLGRDTALRKAKKSQLEATTKGETKPYFDTRSYSARVGAALEDLYGRYRAFYRELDSLEPDALVAAVAALVREIEALDPGLAAFNDTAIVERLLAPFFRAQGDAGRRQRMLDVGACFGQMAAPFLAMNWEVHLFEPDPDSRAVLEKNVASFGPAARIVAAAVSDSGAPEIAFHKAETRGLSGLSPSQFGPTASVLQVPCVGLAGYCREQGIEQVDFLKVDAEGHDFQALASLDLAQVTPRVIMLEFGTNFAGQSIADLTRLLATMKERGYRSLIFGYDDDSNIRRGIWSFRMNRLYVDAAPPADQPLFGNVLFFGADDKPFMIALHALLDCAGPRRMFLEAAETAA